MYFLAILLPPVAVLLKGKPIQAIFNLLLCFCFWIPGVIHAFAVIGSADKKKQHNDMMKMMEKNQKTQQMQLEQQQMQMQNSLHTNQNKLFI